MSHRREPGSAIASLWIYPDYRAHAEAGDSPRRHTHPGFAKSAHPAEGSPFRRRTGDVHPGRRARRRRLGREVGHDRDACDLERGAVDMRTLVIVGPDTISAGRRAATRLHTAGVEERSLSAVARGRRLGDVRARAESGRVDRLRPA